MQLILYVATDLDEIRARAKALEGKVSGITIFIDDLPDNAQAPGRTLRFLQALGPAGFAPLPADGDIVVRIDCVTAGQDTLSRLISQRFAQQLLDIRYLEAARALFSTSPGERIALALPAGLPRIPLDTTDDTSLIPRLAAQLALPQSAFSDTHFFPQALMMMRGGLYKALAQRHHMAAPADEQAITLGFHAICKASGLLIREISPKLWEADPDALRKHQTDVFANTTVQGRHSEYCAPTLRQTPSNPALHYIAYYLPQFHSIPENDRWWGTGFTEWTNITKAAPRFVGHQQPKLPADLGFYDLSSPQTLARQIELARTHGIHGFCFYFYWFNGRTLLETPLTNLLADPTLDFPFCLCWANENWTRRWDGQEHEVLMEQSHSPRDDLRFIEHIAPYLRDPRYIRINGKPLLLVYRATLLDDAPATAQRWRNWCRENGIGEICIAAVRSFDIEDPRPFGFDLAIDFPPHRLHNLPPITPSQTFLDNDFSGEVLDYRETTMLATLAQSNNEPPPFPLLQGVMTGWDNDARRNGNGRIFHHASPSAYANWLRLASTYTLRHNPPHLRYVFINAWNEWAEGAYLEPDRRFGHGYLSATADTLQLFDPCADDTTLQLGSSSGALAHAPAHLLNRHGPLEEKLCRAQLQAHGGTPSIRVALMVRSLSPAVLDSLQSLAEQSLRPFTVSLLTRDEGPSRGWLDHSGIAVDVQITNAPEQEILRIAATNSEEWLILLHAGDRLFPHALLMLASHLCTRPKAQILLSDELERPDEDSPSRLRLRTAPGPSQLLCGRRSGSILGIRRKHFLRLNGFDANRVGALETDFLLRTAHASGWSAINHLPEVLVWRSLQQHPDTVHPQSRQITAQHAAATNYLSLAKVQAEAQILDGDVLRLVHQYDRPPKVSILIATHNQPEALQRCVDTVFSNTQHPDYELVIIDHDNTNPQARTFLDGLAGLDPARIRVLPVTGAFSHSRFINLAAHAANGEFLLLLDDDAAPLHSEWLDALLDEMAMGDVGIVTPRLLFPDGRLQHAGVIPGLSGTADFPWLGAPLGESGPDGLLLHSREVAAASGSCMLIRRGLFEQLDGLDEVFRAGFGDFDFCLRASQAGFRTIWTPHAALMHDTNLTLKAAAQNPEQAQEIQQAFDEGRELFATRWRNDLAHPPYVNANTSLNSRQMVVESEAAFARDPIDWHPLPRILALPADEGGSGHYRISQPVQSAHNDLCIRSRLTTGYPRPAQLERLGIDTLHTQRQVDDAQLKALAELRRHTSLRIVLDFDDLLTKVPRHSHHYASIWPDIERRMIESCGFADCVSTSTEALAEHLRAWHGDVRVVRNGIDPALWSHASTTKRKGQKLRVGWAGGISHAGDLAQVRNVVAELADEVEWVFFGMCLEDMRPQLTEFHKGVPFSDYPRTLAELGLDLAIAPLEPNLFNECKSNLRLLEYGALGIPVIATDILPYRCGLPVTLVDNRPQSWIRAIRDRLGEREALQREGHTLREAVLRDWTQDRMLPDWVAAWTK